MKLIECPRDAMQGIHNFIPTDIKVHYLNLLLQVGFDTLDFGSFVSPRAIPQLQDTAEVLARLDLSSSPTKLLAIVANLKGVQQAIVHEPITYLGFPFSISETFQLRNTNSTREASMATIEDMLALCDKHNKGSVVYLSMGFGNPYGDDWSEEIIEEWSEKLIGRGCRILALADTIGISTPEKIRRIFPGLISRFPGTEFGLHLHSAPDSAVEKIEAAYRSGCNRFDSALKGFGGCPMAKDDLIGNLATEKVIAYLEQQGEDLNLNLDKWREAMTYSGQVFG